MVAIYFTHSLRQFQDYFGGWEGVAICTLKEQLVMFMLNPVLSLDTQGNNLHRGQALQLSLTN
jgi:hypothetical protein